MTQRKSLKTLLLGPFLVFIDFFLFQAEEFFEFFKTFAMGLGLAYKEECLHLKVMKLISKSWLTNWQL